MVRRTYWALLAGLGRLEEAREQIESAIRVDPLSAPSYGDLGYLELFEGRRDRARKAFVRALELNPDLHWAHAGLWILADEPGRETERIRELRAWIAGSGKPELLAVFDRLPAGTTHREIARAVGRRAEELSHGERMSIGVGAAILVAGDELDLAESWLVRAYEAHDPELVWLAMDPAWKPLHARPRIARMLAEMKLPGAAG
jgi:tetratricopeptide (TPR) repeat protein